MYLVRYVKVNSQSVHPRPLITGFGTGSLFGALLDW